MMLVSSTVSTQQPQIDGRFWVVETHSFDDGSIREFSYLADPGTDANAVMAARAAEIEAELAAAAIAVPATVTSVQARRAITAAGLRATVESAVAAADPATQALWYTADPIERANPTLIALATSINLTSDQLDALFRTAAGL